MLAALSEPAAPWANRAPSKTPRFAGIREISTRRRPTRATPVKKWSRETADLDPLRFFDCDPTANISLQLASLLWKVVLADW